MVNLKVKRLNEYAVIPSYANPGDAGMDLYSVRDYIIKPGERELISTGIAVEFSEGYEFQIRPRSGLAIKHGISIVNSPGTVDAGYRGELGVILINHGDRDFEISRGDKIAQGVLSPVVQAEIVEANDLRVSARGDGGFGSSGGHGSLESRT
jgi:dUTP pyrophosphatase|tara:strand:+ start:2490 stop:2945 length:456 start_codon:yes stop_codon:yes gene_type:complete